jgi:hypothetical protein
MQKLPHLFIVMIVLVASLASPLQVKAMSQMAECSSLLGLSWRETGSDAFTILFPQEYAVIGRRLGASQQKAVLDQEYRHMEALFGVSLPLPISIRIYPDVDTYSCLNANADQLPSGAMHGNSGSREIVLIGNAILGNYAAWARNDVNFIRYELSMLFARQVAGDRAPSGLAPALARYMQDPAQTIGLLQLHWSDWLAPTYTWRSLWDEQPGAPDLSRQLQAASVVAFLVDTYGWESLLNFLQRLSSAPNFNIALSETYQADLSQLEAEWRAYYPVYFQGGWRTHLLYNYDLSPYETLLAQEKYAEADTRLLEAIDFLTRMSDTPKLEQAQFLLLRARSGQEAEALFGQSQQAYQTGDFPRSLALLDQAEQKYAQAGASFYHIDEIAAHRDKVAQAHGLRSEIGALDAQIDSAWNTFALAGQILALSRRVGRLGDLDGYQQIKQMAQVVEARQRGQFLVFAAAILAVIVVLLLVLLRLARRVPPPEAQL